MEPIIQKDTRNATQVLSTGKLNLYIFNSLHPGIFLTFSFPFYQECGDTLTTFSRPLTVSNNIATSGQLVSSFIFFNEGFPKLTEFIGADIGDHGKGNIRDL